MSKKQMVIVSSEELNDLKDMSDTSVFANIKDAKNWVKAQILDDFIGDGKEDDVWFIYELKPLLTMQGAAVDVKIKETKL